MSRKYAKPKPQGRFSNANAEKERWWERLLVFGVWQRILSLAIAVAICSWCVSMASIEPHRVIKPYKFPNESYWIAARGDRMAGAVFRLDFKLPPAKIARAWVAISADNGFEVIMNGNPCGRWTLYRATRDYQNGHTEFGQRLRYQPGALRLNYPREYQWSDNKNWQLPMFLDVTRYLKAGEMNALSVTAQARHPNCKFVLTGEIIFENGQRMPLNSHMGWKGSYVPLGANDREWTETGFPIDHWPQAREIEPRYDSLWRIPPYGIFETPFLNKWRLAPQKGEAVFRTTVNIKKKDFDAAWVRILSLGPYIMRINGKPLRPITGPGYNNSQGMWLAQPASRKALAIAPERVDKDEVGGVHIGETFLSPAHGDVMKDIFKTNDKKLNLNDDPSMSVERRTQLKRAYEDKPVRPNMADPMKEELDIRLPKKLAARHAKLDLVGFDIKQFLVEGENEIEVALVDVNKKFNMPNARRIAVDMGLVRGTEVENILQDEQPWTINDQRSEAVMPPDYNKLRQIFLQVKQPAGFPHYIVGVTSFLLAVLLLSYGYITGTVSRVLLKMMVSPMWSAAMIVILSELLKISMAERSEYIWFISNNLWRWLVVASAAAVALTMTRFRFGYSARPSRDRSSHRWKIVLLAVLFLGLLVRYNGVDDQALDDDEYASVQTTLNIAISGLPEIYKGIWYTRGPFYHYLAGGLIVLFGDNIWVMRGPAIAAGLIAALFSYLIGSRVIKSQPIGVAAALLICLNPFCIFTSHVARFYQQQQTMTVATIYFFICGFIQQSVPWKRALAFICFGIAVLSQEISLLLIVPCAICYALMAKPETLRNEIKFAAVAALVMGCIVLNLLAFKVKCLTRLEGISPNIESTMSPHFAYPLNFFSLFMGYARIHVLLAPFSVIGMIVCLRKRATGMLAVTFFLLAGIFGTVLLVTGLGFRYQYSYLPLWVLAAVYGIKVVSARVTRGWSHKAQAFLSLIIVGFGVASFSPWRIPESYSIRILPDSSGAASYVRANIRPGDKIAITEPHPHCALLEAGRADYDICIPILYDFVYRSEEDGRLVDRNGGAESMGRIGTLQRAMAQHDRIWILLNREKIKNVSRNFRWEYAGARFDYFVRQNCQVMYRAYSWDVYLWDRTRGVNQTFRMEPEAWAE
ncbi:MAG: glycosyltransferase family 39 protein [Planctomycetota bacterium]